LQRRERGRREREMMPWSGPGLASPVSPPPPYPNTGGVGQWGWEWEWEDRFGYWVRADLRRSYSR